MGQTVQSKIRVREDPNRKIIIAPTPAKTPAPPRPTHHPPRRSPAAAGCNAASTSLPLRTGTGRPTSHRPPAPSATGRRPFRIAAAVVSGVPDDLFGLACPGRAGSARSRTLRSVRSPLSPLLSPPPPRTGRLCRRPLALCRARLARRALCARRARPLLPPRSGFRIRGALRDRLTDPAPAQISSGSLAPAPLRRPPPGFRTTPFSDRIPAGLAPFSDSGSGPHHGADFPPRRRIPRP